MKKVYVVLILITICSFKLNKITDGRKVSIYIDTIDDYFLPYKINEWDSIKLPKKTMGYVYLLDFKGSMYLKVIKNNKIICQGKYLNSLDTFKHYVESYNSSGLSTLQVDKYFFPIKDSTWVFYDEKLKKHVSKEYRRGILING